MGVLRDGLKGRWMGLRKVVPSEFWMAVLLAKWSESSRDMESVSSLDFVKGGRKEFS